MEKLFVVYTTFSDEKDAKKVAKRVLKKRLAACVQISSKIKSLYWWKDEIEQSTEYIVSLKVLAKDYPKLEKFLKKHHPYDVPEIVAFAAKKVEQDYLEWVIEETSR